MNRKYTIDNQDIIELKAGDSRAGIVTSLGGTVYNLSIQGKDLLFSDPEAELTKNDWFRGRLLFPFNDRIPQGKYTWEGETCQFPLNCDGKDSIHGLIYNKEMTVVEESESTLKLSVEIPADEFKGYPFHMVLEVFYTLTEESFSMDFTIINKGSGIAPFSLGWHPYFITGESVNTSSLSFNSGVYYDVNEDLYFEGKILPVAGTELDFTEGRTIGESELDIAVSVKGEGKALLADKETRLELTFDEELFPCLQLFIPPDRKSFAVEPVSAPSDTFNYPETGLILLGGGETKKGSIKVKSL